MSASTQTEYKHVSELDKETAGALLQFVMSFADSKYLLGRRMSEWVTSAPAMEATVAAANITQEELGHARSLFAMIRDLPGAPIDLDTEADLAREEYFNPTYLDHPWHSWIDVIANLFLLDTAFKFAIDSARNSSLIPLRQRVAKIIQEEHFHNIYCQGWLARLATTSPAGKDNLETALRKVWPVAAAWFGPSTDQSLAPLLRAGILTTSLFDRCKEWTKSIQTIAAKNGLQITQQSIDWTGWQKNRREVLLAR